MLFQGLSKLKRSSIMTAVVLMAVGVMMVICPDEYIESLISTLGIIMLVAAVVLVLEFIGSKKAMFNFILLTVGLFLWIVGAMILIFEIDTLYALAWIFGILLILDGLHSLFHALMFARRSGRRGWGVLIPLSLLLILFGVIVIINQWWNTPGELMNVIGWMIVFSAAVSTLRLIWIWPVKDK